MNHLDNQATWSINFVQAANHNLELPACETEMEKKPPEEQIASQLKKLVKSIKCLNLEKIILLSSIARANYTVHSDIDTVIIMQSDRSFFERTYDNDATL